MLETDFDPRVLASQGVPSGIDQMEPGPVLAAFLSSIDVNAVSGYDRIFVLRAHQRMASHYAAQVYNDMAAVTESLREFEDNPQFAAESAAAEIRTALHLTRRTTDIELSFALDLQERLPRVWEMLASGAIDQRRARVIDSATFHLTIGSARNVVARVEEAAPHLTTGELRARIAKLCIEANPAEAKERYEHAVTDRRIVSEPTLNGTANLTGYDLPPDRVTAITRHINSIARSLRGDGETRTMDQLRADVYLDILLGTNHKTATRNGVIDIQVDLDTLAGLTDHPGELSGYGPVISDIARQVAQDHENAQWRYTITDTETGEPIHTGITRRRPTASQRRRIEARDRTCIFPGCRMPAIENDIDHTKAYAEGGPTTGANLASLCRHDHCLRHNGWTYKPIPGGRYQWTSRLGHTYTTTRAPP